MQAREPADGEQRRPGEREDAREKSRADDLGDDEHLQAQQAMPARDQPESEQLERKQDRGGYGEGDHRSMGRKARDARLAPADARQLAEPRHAGLHGVPYPLFEKNPQRRQERERAARHSDKNDLEVPLHSMERAQKSAQPLTLTLSPFRGEGKLRDLLSSRADRGGSEPCRLWAGSACRLRYGTPCACPTSSTSLCLSSRRSDRRY